MYSSKMINLKQEKLEGKQNTNERISIKNQNNQIIYYQPIFKSMKKQNYKMFHPENWTIRNFQIGRRLGRGKFGYVYLARQRQTKIILALKILQKSKIFKEDVIHQIRRQIQVHSHLNHVNLLKMYGFFYDQTKIYIMLQYAPKGQLYALMKKNKFFDQGTVRNYMKQIILAIQYLQTLNIIHRDIKPENILISTNNVIKLSDFGFAIKSKSQQRYTYCGTFQYFCPQIVKFQKTNYKVDNWSLGILAYQLLTGRSPFLSKNKHQMQKNIINAPIMFPEKANSQFRDFIMKLCRKDPTQRIQLSEALNHPWLCSSKNQKQNSEKMDIEKYEFQ